MSFKSYRRNFLFAVVLLLNSCAAPTGTPPQVGAVAPKNTYSLFDPATVIQDQWQHMPLRWETEYRLVYLDGRLALRAVGRESASGVIRRVQVDPNRCPVLEWTWRVERLQSDANLRVKESDDVAASLFLLFGDPGFFSNPDPVPTLRYVWPNDRVPKTPSSTTLICLASCATSSYETARNESASGLPNVAIFSRISNARLERSPRTPSKRSPCSLTTTKPKRRSKPITLTRASFARRVPLIEGATNSAEVM